MSFITKMWNKKDKKNTRNTCPPPARPSAPAPVSRSSTTTFVPKEKTTSLKLESSSDSTSHSFVALEVQPPEKPHDVPRTSKTNTITLSIPPKQQQQQQKKKEREWTSSSSVKDEGSSSVQDEAKEEASEKEVTSKSASGSESCHEQSLEDDIKNVLQQQQTASVVCPICSENLDIFSEEERNTHVSNCLGEPPSRPTVQAEKGPLDPLPLVEYSPFAVTCPYLQCGRQYEACDFPAHVNNHHKNATQKYSCPICILQGEAAYKPNENTNLLKHIERTHTDLVPRQQGVPTYDYSGRGNYGGIGLREQRKDRGEKARAYEPNTKAYAKAPDPPNQRIYKRTSSAPKPETDLHSLKLKPTTPKTPVNTPGSVKPPPVVLTTTTTKTTTTNTEVNQPSDYIASSVTQVTDKECEICFCEFELGQITARLQCLCLFHQNCVEKWFSKKGKRDCPLHGNDDPTPT